MLLFRIKEGKKSFSDKQNLKVFVTTKPPLQKKLKGIAWVEREDRHKSTKMKEKRKENKIKTQKY